MTQDISLGGSVTSEPLRAVTRAPVPIPDGPTVARAAVAAVPNPTLRLDSGLGMVVIEFRDSSGEVVASLPTPREINAYRVAAITTAPASSRDRDDPTNWLDL